MIWSMRDMSKGSTARLMVRVTRMSSAPGLGLPEGWLWMMIRLLAFFSSAFRTSTLVSIVVLLIPPVLRASLPMT